jgi:hypothetical protein
MVAQELCHRLQAHQFNMLAEAEVALYPMLAVKFKHKQVAAEAKVDEEHPALQGFQTLAAVAVAVDKLQMRLLVVATADQA